MKGIRLGFAMQKKASPKGEIEASMTGIFWRMKYTTAKSLILTSLSFRF